MSTLRVWRQSVARFISIEPDKADLTKVATELLVLGWGRGRGGGG